MNFIALILALDHCFFIMAATNFLVFFDMRFYSKLSLTTSM